MIELFVLLGFFVLGWIVGQANAYWKMRHIVREYARHQGIDVGEDFTINEPAVDKKITISVLKVEKINDMLYLYDVATDNFVGQAPTLDALAIMVKETKDIKLAGIIYDEARMWFVDGKVFNTLEEVSPNES